MTDMVNHPPHYTEHKIFSRECIEYTREMNFTSGNAFKYLYRQGQKFNTKEDIEKAIWYIKDELSHQSCPRMLPDNILEEMEKELTDYAKQKGIDLDINDISKIDDRDVIIGFIMIEIANIRFFSPFYKERSNNLIEKLVD